MLRRARPFTDALKLTPLLLLACSSDSNKPGGEDPDPSMNVGGSGGSGKGGSGAGSGGKGGSGSGGTPGMGGTMGEGGAPGMGGTMAVDAAEPAPDMGGGAGGSMVADASMGGGDVAPGVSPMMSFFITSRKGGGDLGGLDGADAICKMLATAVGLGNKTWHAYLSTENPRVDAKSRVGMGPWFNAKGVMVAKDLADLHDGAMPKNNLNGMTALDEHGNLVPGRMNRPPGTVNEHDIITGTQMDGTVVPGQTCGDWKNAGATARVGHFDRGGGGGQVPMSDATCWMSSHNNQGCGPETIKPGGGAGRFYCFAVTP
jgi:hypothetical protein